jgi:hypothetical protein
VKLDLPALLVLDALATYRLTRLVTDDTITEPIRHWLGGWDPAVLRVSRPRTWDFITCPWCTSVWIGAGVVALTALWPVEWAYGAAALAFSAVAGFLKGHE